MCLDVFTSHLGNAHAGLHAPARIMVLSPRLTAAERVTAARQLLAWAGREQPSITGEVICLCGLALDVALRLRHPAAHVPWCTGQCLDGDCRDRRREPPVERLAPDWEWASSSKLAAWLGIGVPALSYLRQKKEAPRGHRVGKEIRYRRADVETWLATRADP